MGVIYRNNKKYGGFFTGPALDITCDTANTAFTSDNIQGVVEEISDVLINKTAGTHSITNICVGVNPTTNKAAIVVSWNDGTSDKVGYIDFTN